MKKPFKIDVSILKGSETQKNVDDLQPESAKLRRIKALDQSQSRR